MSTELRLPCAGVRSLVFDGARLVDHVAGGRVLELDGTVHPARVSYAYRFDTAVASPRVAALAERLGTKAILVDRASGRVIRQLDRSFYQAHVYVYPLALWTGPSGHTLVAHCSQGYNHLDIDDVDTGECLTRRERSPLDRFHSRLAVSPGGTWLLDAGWVWHPVDYVEWYDLAEVLRDPTALDRPRSLPGSLHVGLAEEGSAAWQTDATLLVGSSAEPEDPETVAEVGDQPRLPVPAIAVVDAATATITHTTPLPHPAGEMLAVGVDRVVTLFEHPRLYRLSDGALLEEWPHLPTGRVVSSIRHHLPAPPPIALDPAGARFAVATADAVHVVTLGP